MKNKILNDFFYYLKMSVPKSKILSVTRGVLGLSEMKIGNAKQTQKVVLNINNAVNTAPKGVRKAVIDGEEASDVVIVEPSPQPSVPTVDDQEVKASYDNNPYMTREISTEDDIRKDYEQLLAVVKTKDAITQALSMILNIVEHNPLIVNKYIISPKDILANLIQLLTQADKVDIILSMDDVGCSCSANSKIAVIDKIYVTKDGNTTILKYGFAETLQILENHRISTKFVLNENAVEYN